MPTLYVHDACPAYGAPLSEDDNRMPRRDYGYDTSEVDSGELWLPAASQASSHAPVNDKRRGRHEPRLSQGREKRAVRLLLLALPRLMDREMVWMSPQLRNLSPAMRVKIIYELEKLGATLAQM